MNLQNTIMIVITKQPITTQYTTKLYWYLNGTKSEKYFTTSNIVSKSYRGPGLYEAVTEKTSNNKWTATKLTYKGPLPNGYTQEDFAEMETFCFDFVDLIDNQDDTYDFVCYSSFDIHKKHIIFKVNDSIADDIDSLDFKIVRGGKYKISRNHTGAGKYNYLWCTMKLQNENIETRKKQWEAGKYKDRTVDQNLSDFLF